MSDLDVLTFDDLEEIDAGTHGEVQLRGYLDSEFRSEEIDDALLDAANQLGFTYHELKRWVTGRAAAALISEAEERELDAEDFKQAFYSSSNRVA